MRGSRFLNNFTVEEEELKNHGCVFILLSDKVDEPSFYIRPDELNANSISNIKTFKSSYQLSFHRRVKQADPGPLF
jgi:hypothetical protein